MNSMIVSGLHRYLVKSMAGESLESANISAAGIEGDRAFAIVDSTNRLGSAKRTRAFGALPLWRPRLTGPGKVEMTHPDGRCIASHDSAAMATAFGSGVTLQAFAQEGVLLEFEAGTLSGKHAETTEVPPAGAAPSGTFFDLAPLMIVTAATLRALGGEEGAQACAIRLRPNIVMEGETLTPFAENEWVGRRIAIGKVVLSVILPCPRCVMPSLAHPGLPADPELLRRIASMNTLDLGDYGKLPCAGVYATVESSGPISCGDAASLLDH